MKDNQKSVLRLHHDIRLRNDVGLSDPEKIRQLSHRTGFFYPEELDVVEELVRECLAKGTVSGYHFILAEHYNRLVGYVCFGPIACTESSFDVYWIAVLPEFQGRGLGEWLLGETEGLIRKAGGTRVYIETSQRDQYASTRAFYESKGYRSVSAIDDFYRPGEAKVIYCKVF